MAKKAWLERVKRGPKVQVRGYYAASAAAQPRYAAQVQAVPHLFRELRCAGDSGVRKASCRSGDTR